LLDGGREIGLVPFTEEGVVRSFRRIFITGVAFGMLDISCSWDAYGLKQDSWIVE